MGEKVADLHVANVHSLLFAQDYILHYFVSDKLIT